MGRDWIRGPIMTTYLDENGNPSSAAPSAKVYLDPNTGEPMHASQAAAPDLTSNPHREGVYLMQSQNSTTSVPYSSVPQAAQQGYGFADDSTRFRYAKDSAADPNQRGGAPMVMGSGMSPQQSTARANQIEDTAALPMQMVGGIAKGAGTFARPLLDGMDYAATGNTRDVGPMLDARTPGQRVGKFGTIAAMAVPAFVAAPLATAGGVIGGTVGAGAGQVIGKATGMSSGGTDVLSDTLGLAGGAAGAMGAQPLVGALNTSARNEAAGQLFQSVAQDANKAPVSLDNAGEAALRLMDWQKKTNLGPTLNKFLNRITNPNQGPLTYGEGRDFYQLLGNMSANDKMTLPPTVMHDVNAMLEGLRTDVGNAASLVGRGNDYEAAMTQYKRAAQVQDTLNTVKNVAMKAAGPVATGAGVGSAYKLWQWITGK
jgi:hypothetical protein